MGASTKKGFEKLRYIFENNLNVGLLSEEIITCSLDDDAYSVRTEMKRQDFDIYGVKDKDRTVGYVKKDELSSGKIKEFVRKFSSEDLISDSTSLVELLDIFQNREYIFILETNKVSKIVTIADLHKQPIRMLAFSLISLLEMYLTSVIREVYPDDSWKDKLKEDRLKKALEILNMRLVKNEALTLLDSTQLSDKGVIVQNTPELLEQLGFLSKNRCKEFFKNLEDLRNNTAHSQEIIYHDNKELIKIMLQIKNILETNTVSN